MSRLIKHALMSFLSLIFLIPLIWMISTSLKTPDQLYTDKIQFIPSPIDFSNYVKAFTQVNILQAFKNTLFLCLVNIIGVVLSCSLAGYAFAIFNWKFKELFFYITLSTMMLPDMVTLVPQFIFFQKLGLYGSLLPLIIPFIFGNPFFIFLFRQFFLSIPKQLRESASIDGYSEFQIYKNIYMPLSTSVISVVVLFQFLATWNDLIRPSVYLINQNQYTLSLSLQQFKSQHGGTEWSLLMAASSMIVVPVIILFFFTQKSFVQGLTMTGMKD